MHDSSISSSKNPYLRIMSYSQSLPNNESNRSRDPRHRDRSRSEIRRTDDADILPPSLITNQPPRLEQSTPTNGVLDFFKTLGLNSQLIQALINANPPKIEQVQQQPSVNNAQEFASFLSKSYGLDSSTNSPPTQSVNRDPRRRHIPPVTTPVISPNSNHVPPTDISSRFIQPSVSRSNSMITSDTLLNVNNTSTSIDELYKQYLSTIDQSLLVDEIRQRFQRIALLDNELDKLHRMNIELIKNSERRSRRRTSRKDKDPLLRENENLQTELIDYIKTLKTTMMINYPTYMFNHNTNIRRQ